VEIGHAEQVDERLGVVGQQPARVRAGRLGARTDAPVIDAKHPVAGREEIVHLGEPRLDVVGEAVDQDDRLVAVTIQLVVQINVVDLGKRHDNQPPVRMRMRA
jgi:hypothetical protein